MKREYLTSEKLKYNNIQGECNTLKANKEIRAPKVRLIDAAGNQVGVVLIKEALKHAEDSGLDLVEVVPNTEPPVCKIMDLGKFRYDQTKREKDNKKAHHQIKIKEIKLRPNIDTHDLKIKITHAKEFIEKGNKVKVTCTFRGREMLHQELAHAMIDKFLHALEDIAQAESEPKLMGRNLMFTLAPASPKKRASFSADSA